jgi:hypothetical protein
MADPEVPELRAELQREDRPDTRNRYDQAPPRLGPKMVLWALFVAAVIGVIAFAYGLI